MSLADALLEPLDGDAFEPTPRALELARWFLLDTLSVGLAGSAIAADFVAPFAGTLQHLSAPGPSAAFAAGARLVPHAAAAVNAASVHTLDFDDSYLSGVKAHLSTSVVPAALAVSEEVGASGRDCLEAFVRGFEVAARLGHAVVPSHLAHWHPTGTLGVVGSAAAAAWLYRLDRGECESALALAADRAAGTRFCLVSGDATKSLHAAYSAHDGVLAATLARAGVAGPRGFFEGVHGFVATYSAVEPAAASFTGLGHPAIEDNCTKFLPCMHGLQAAALAAIAIAERHPLADAGSVEAVVVHQTRGRAHMGRNWHPETELAARLSLPYVVAVSLRERACGLEQFRQELLESPELRDLMQRVSVEPSDRLEREYGSRVVSEVHVRFADGSEEHEEYADPPGTPQRPATEEERVEKFHRLAGMRLGTDAVEAVLHRGLELDKAPSVVPLTDAVLAGLAAASAPQLEEAR